MIHQAVLALASYTGWPLSEMDEMTVEELLEWCGHLPKATK